MLVKKRKIIDVYIFFLLLCGAIITHRFLYAQSTIIQNIYSCAVYPALRLQAVLVDSVMNVVHRRQDAERLRCQIEQVLCESADLRAENIALHSALRYQKDTQELRAFNSEHTEFEGARIVQVLMRVFSPTEHYFLVDAGSRSGIEENMVAVYKNCLIGRVDQVYPWYSKVRLITDKSCKVAAYCVGADARGIHEGCNSVDRTMLRYVNHLSDVTRDELVMSSGQGVVFPRGLGLGKVAAYEKDNLYYTVTVKPIINLHQLRYCTILAKR